MKQTKIVCSVSDRNYSEEFLRKLFFAGMDIMRINTAHATIEGVKGTIRNAHAVSSNPALLINTREPEVRTTNVAEPLLYKTGEVVRIFDRPSVNSTYDIINVLYADIAKDLKVGNDILIDDGVLDIGVIDVIGPMVVIQVMNDGVLGAHKSANTPGRHIDLPALTKKDKHSILFAIEQDIDFIAHSSIRSAQNVKAVQDILDEHHSDIKIISKIESQEGVDNIDETADASYGVMIARDSLGTEVPIEEVPGIQRQIIHKRVMRKESVIVITQMPHAMINNPRPTKVEVTDIANAIYSRTDALILSSEAASGRHSIGTVQTMVRIAEQAEADRTQETTIDPMIHDYETQREFLAHSATESTRRLGVKSIITASEMGQVARTLLSFYDTTPTLAICYRKKTQRLLNLSYRVIPIYQKEHASSGYLFTAASKMLRQKGYIKPEDKIAYLSGSFGKSGSITLLETGKVGQAFDNSYEFHLPHYVKDETGAK